MVINVQNHNHGGMMLNNPKIHPTENCTNAMRNCIEILFDWSLAPAGEHHTSSMYVAGL
jgi:hypothetical protein